MLFLFASIKEYRVIASEAVSNAMTATDRKFYSPRNPYMDAPQSIGHGVTISAPHMVFFLQISYINAVNIFRFNI